MMKLHVLFLQVITDGHVKNVLEIHIIKKLMY